ncbi:hypothetical protein [Winogradskyella endarachnes]|uniref:Uncharacterized protein n=1 Tax=Winogradskyella endarachnes TaxID=2681965 RepID=A0A6L6U6L7_9FLAO|nr:hypothetical protein [Winogradskyella endarachnes]MUU77895.1 hypothetical protein [Winogradskyella endarachnes]
MKIKFSLLLLLVSVFSCDDLDELTEIDIIQDFTTTISVDVPEDSEGQPQSFSTSTTLDISDNEEIQDNIDLIENMSINSITYEITNFSGSEGAILTEGQLIFGTTTIAVSNINLEQSDIDNTLYTITDTSGFNEIANNLENNLLINVSLAGTVNETPVVFDIEVNIDLTVTVDVL